MQQVINRMELASLNSGLAEAYMKEAEESLHLAVEKLEGCLRSVNQLRSHGFGTRAMDGKEGCGNFFTAGRRQRHGHHR